MKSFVKSWLVATLVASAIIVFGGVYARVFLTWVHGLVIAVPIMTLYSVIMFAVIPVEVDEP